MDSKTSNNDENNKSEEEQGQIEQFKSMFSEELKNNHKTKKQFSMQEIMWKGIIFFFVIIASFICAYIVMHFSNILTFAGKVTKILEPILCGFIIAYLLNPIMKRIENILFYVTKLNKEDHKIKKRFRVISIFSSLFLASILIFILLNAVLPDLIASIALLVKDLPAKFVTARHWVKTISIDSHVDYMIQKAILESEKYIENWVRTDLLGKFDSFFGTLTNGVFGVLGVLENIFIGVIVSIYLLANKECFNGQIKKVLYAIFPEKTTNGFLEVARDSDRIFMGFLSGKIIDSLIIGGLCFILLSIFHIPYSLVVSVIVGVTNIIPFFGPYIGGIPSALLILLTNTSSGIIFIIIIVILQQIDGNLIGPKILGNSTGLSAFWVIVSILLGSGLFGFPGMIFGVPTFAVIYHIVGRFINTKLNKRHLPTNTEEYTNIVYIQNKQPQYNNHKTEK